MTFISIILETTKLKNIYLTCIIIRVGVKYTLSKTNTNTFFLKNQIQIQIQIFITFLCKYKYI